MVKVVTSGFGLLLVLALGAQVACSGSSSSDGGGGSSGSGATGGGGAGGSSGGGGSGGANCQCTNGAYAPVCGSDGKTYDAACGTQCVPVAIACQGECPCGDSGSPACGTLGSCLAGTTCVEEMFEPSCQNLSDPNADCPTGQTKSICGGAGGTCCCDPPPPSQYSCQATSGCAGSIDCSCITCPNGKWCMATAGGPFLCKEPPKP